MTRRGRPPKLDTEQYRQPDSRHYDPGDGILWHVAVLALAYKEEAIACIGDDLDEGEQAIRNRKEFLDRLAERLGNADTAPREVLLPEERETIWDTSRRLQAEGDAWYKDPTTALLTRDQREAMQEALALFGPDTLWTPLRPREVGLDDLPLDPDHDFDHLRSLVRARIKRLWQHAMNSSESNRRDARDQLTQILAALVPSGRGRGEGPRLQPTELLLRYCDYLLRWHLVKPEYLRRRRANMGRPRSLASTLAETYGLPEETVRQHLGFEEVPHVTEHDRAIAMLAEELKKKRDTIEQDLSSARKARPRT